MTIFEEYINFKIFRNLKCCGVIPVQSFGSHIHPQLPRLGLISLQSQWTSTHAFTQFPISRRWVEGACWARFLLSGTFLTYCIVLFFLYERVFLTHRVDLCIRDSLTIEMLFYKRFSDSLRCVYIGDSLTHWVVSFIRDFLTQEGVLYTTDSLIHWVVQYIRDPNSFQINIALVYQTRG
jgi:hypothetical protein